MNGEPDDSARFDRMARAIHAEAVDRIAPHLLARMRPQPRAAGRRSWRPAPVLGWSLAAACAAVLAWAVGFHTMVTPGEGPAAADPLVADAPPQAAGVDPWDDPLMTFEEDPDLFVWLASDARSLAME